MSTVDFHWWEKHRQPVFIPPPMYTPIQPGDPNDMNIELVNALVDNIAKLAGARECSYDEGVNKALESNLKLLNERLTAELKKDQDAPLSPSLVERVIAEARAAGKL